MTRRIQHKRSSVPGKIPDPADLLAGELAINFADRAIHTKSEAGSIVRMNVHAAIGAPPNPIPGDNHINVTTGKFYVYYNAQWNEISPPYNLNTLLAYSGGTMYGPLTVVVPATGNELVSAAQLNEMFDAAHQDYLRRDGMTAMTGPLKLASAPFATNNAADKAYVDAAVTAATPDLSAYLKRTGGIMTGQIVLPNAPTGNQAISVNELKAGFIQHEVQPDPHTNYVLQTELDDHRAHGGHEHVEATADAAGFMSDEDKKRFDAMTAADNAALDAGTDKDQYVSVNGLAHKSATGVLGKAREKLIADRTYYVRTDGDDENDGLTDTVDGAFLTWQRAVDVAADLDFDDKNVTLKCTQSDVTFAAGAVIPPITGIRSFGQLAIHGDLGMPENVTIATTGYGFRANGGMAVVRGFKFTITATASDAIAISATNRGIIGQQLNEFGEQTGAVGFLNCHMQADNFGHVFVLGDYTISGKADQHLIAMRRGHILTDNHEVTITNTPRFVWYAHAAMHSVINYRMPVTYVGTATGVRYNITSKSVAANPGVFPGSGAGIVGSGGFYIA